MSSVGCLGGQRRFTYLFIMDTVRECIGNQSGSV